MVNVLTTADIPDRDDEPGVEDPVDPLREYHIVYAAVKEDTLPGRLSKVNIDRNICTISHARYDCVARISRAEVDISPVTLALESTGKESSVQDTGDKTFIGPVAADFPRAQLLYRRTTQKVELDLTNAMALGCSDPILPTVIPDGLKTPLGIMLNLIQDICNSGLEVCNIMGSVHSEKRT